MQLGSEILEINR